MKYRYPRINNWLTFSETDTGEYVVTDHLNDESYRFGNRIARFAERLDGRTDPRDIMDGMSDREAAALLEKLDEFDLLRRSRVLSASVRGAYFTLLTPKINIGSRGFPAVANVLLKCLFLPVFILGAFAFFNSGSLLSGKGVILNAAVGVLTGMAAHEAAHAVACVGSGGKVFEIGVMLEFPFAGAYVLMDTGTVKGALKRAQIEVAGIEANLFLAGIALLFAALLSWNTLGFFVIALVNTELALINLLLVDGLDGAGIMSTLLGKERLKDSVNSFWKHLRGGQGIPGIGVIDSVIGVATTLIQPAYALLVVLNVLVVIR